VVKMECLFCKIIKGELPSYKLYEDDLVMVIMDAYPNVDGHTLIIPKEHYDTFMDLPDNLVTHINAIAKKYTNHIMDRLNAKELSICVNYGNSQKIKHYHMHLLPNYGLRSEKKVEEVYEVLK
jgi:histidine triad (HIT) family protein